jgi:hypothetical protein
VVNPEGELMAKYRITGPDGSTYEVTAPEGASESDVLAYAQKNFAKPQKAEESSLMGSVAQGAGNAVAGLVRGAGSIGATILAPVDMARDALAGKGLSLESNRQRRADMDGGLQEMGAQPDSMLYKAGKLGGEIAGTAGAGGVLANGVRAVGATRAMAGLEPVVQGVARGLETGGFRVGELAGTGMGALARVGTGAATGATAAGMVNPQDAGLGALIGGALPGATQLAGKAGMAMRSSMGAASPEVAALAKRAQELGIQIPADRMVNSKPLNAVAAALNYMPGSGRAATEEAMNSQLNQALSKTFGQNSPNVTQALRKAETQLGGQFDDFLRSNRVVVDKQFIDDLAGAANQASKELGTDGAGIIGKQIDDILAKAQTGEIDGQAAYNIKKTLDRIGNRNSPEAWYALDLKHKLMEALNRSVGPEKAKSFGQVRQQYGAMLDLQKLAKNGAEGEISVARLANMKGQRNPQMQELADIAAQFVKPREGQHGAAQRALVGAAGFGMGGLPGLLGGMAVGRGANAALNSKSLTGLLMGGQMAAEPQTLGLLTQGAYRALPLIPAQ